MPTTLFVIDATSGSPWLQTQAIHPDPALVWTDQKGRRWQGFSLPSASSEALQAEAAAKGIALRPLAIRPLSSKPWQEDSDKGKILASIRSALSEDEASLVGSILRSFLVLGGLATDRASFYKTREEQQAYEETTHDRLFQINRGLYALCALLPGLTDRTLQEIFRRLLHLPRQEGAGDLCSKSQEDAILRWIASSLPVPRLLKLFLALRMGRVNNARTRKFCLRTLLGQAKLELWSVRYRRKLRMILEHALGKRLCSILRSILARPAAEWTSDEKSMIGQNLLSFAPPQGRERVLSCVAFVLGVKAGVQGWDLPLLYAYEAAKTDLEKGSALPFETLEGLRSTYHKDRPSSEVLERTKAKLTQGQAIRLQKKAEESGVSVALDVSKYEPLRLYLYAYQRGMTAEIEAALEVKAKAAAEGLPASFGFRHAGIVLDASASMFGHTTQALRPIASMLSIRDLLRASSTRTTEVICGGRPRQGDQARLIDPEGDTSLASGFLQAVEAKPDAIFLLSDGYENAPAGRLAEVIAAVRRLGFSRPVYQFSPVLSADDQGLRALAPAWVPTIPVVKPESLGIGLLAAILENDPIDGLGSLLDLLTQRLASLHARSPRATKAFGSQDLPGPDKHVPTPLPPGQEAPQPASTASHEALEGSKAEALEGRKAEALEGRKAEAFGRDESPKEGTAQSEEDPQ